MPKVRKILDKRESGRNYYLVDACFLANKYIPESIVPAGKKQAKEQERIHRCKEYWAEIDKQIKRGKARVYIPDVCIAEAFKVLAKKYYSDGWFTSAASFHSAKRKLSRDIRTSPKELKAQNRRIRYHDISTSRDIIISVDRFFEAFMKQKEDVSVPDLIIIATAKYLMDFYDIPKDSLHVITLDHALWEGIKRITELPTPLNPARYYNRASSVFAETPIKIKRPVRRQDSSPRTASLNFPEEKNR